MLVVVTNILKQCLRVVFVILNYQDNCHDDVNVKIVVKSNEIQQNSIAETFTYHAPEVTATQATVLYAPST